MPLETPLKRVGSVPLGQPDTAHVRLGDASLADGGNVERSDDWFSPGSFLDLTGADALNRPSFERLQAGVGLRLAVARGAAFPRAVEVKEFVKPEVPAFALLVGAHGFSLGLLLAIGGRSGEPTARTTDPKIRLVDEDWRVRGDGGEFAAASETAAHAAAAELRGVRAAVASVDAVDLAGIA